MSPWRHDRAGTTRRQALSRAAIQLEDLGLA
jgi:hypothetical protein